MTIEEKITCLEEPVKALETRHSDSQTVFSMPSSKLPHQDHKLVRLLEQFTEQAHDIALLVGSVQQIDKKILALQTTARNIVEYAVEISRSIVHAGQALAVCGKSRTSAKFVTLIMPK